VQKNFNVECALGFAPNEVNNLVVEGDHHGILLVHLQVALGLPELFKHAFGQLAIVSTLNPELMCDLAASFDVLIIL